MIHNISEDSYGKENEPEITIMKRPREKPEGKRQPTDQELMSQNLVRSLVESVPDIFLKQIKLRKKRILFKETL